MENIFIKSSLFGWNFPVLPVLSMTYLLPLLLLTLTFCFALLFYVYTLVSLCAHKNRDRIRGGHSQSTLELRHSGIGSLQQPSAVATLSSNIYSGLLMAALLVVYHMSLCGLSVASFSLNFSLSFFVGISMTFYTPGGSTACGHGCSISLAALLASMY